MNSSRAARLRAKTEKFEPATSVLAKARKKPFEPAREDTEVVAGSGQHGIDAVAVTAPLI
jgi:hypothetical protein